MASAVVDELPRPAEGTEAVVVAGVRRRFGDVQALSGLDFTAPYGEVTGLVGPNGAGKTTLLLVMASLLVPDAGMVRIGGHDPLTDARAVRSVMGWVPDAIGFYDNLTTREYLYFAAAEYGFGSAASWGCADQLLQIARLSEFADRPVHVLSRGQKQRLGFVRALVHSPKILLLDEPAAGLDPTSRIELREFVRHLAATGVAIVVSSHVLSDLEQMADRVVFVDQGRTVGERRMTELGSMVGPQRWRLSALDPGALQAALQRYGMSYTTTAAGLEVEVGSQEQAAQLVGQLVGDGVPILTSTPVTSSLEAAYLDMTGRER